MFLLLQTAFRFMGMLCSHKREREREGGAVIERERERERGGGGAAQHDTCTSIQDSSV